MSIDVTGHVLCEKGARYVEQLIKHWSHKFDASCQHGEGNVAFSESFSVHFASNAQRIDIALTVADAAEAARMRGIVEKHLDRFAFREAPLTFHWNET